MSQGDWLTVGSVVVSIGPMVAGVAYWSWVAWRTHGKETV